MRYSVEQLADIAGAAITGNKETTVERVYFDSRRITHTQNALFVAVKTHQNDGHRYLRDAHDRGIRIFLVDHLPDELLSESTFLNVQNTLNALQKIAAHHRNSFHGPLVAITGSNGKTIVKEWAATLLSEHRKVAKTPASYNSQIGVALSLLGLKEDHQFGVFEAGISKPGEMDALREMLRPTVGLITNIGEAHGENFESRDQKLSEKLSLFDGCERLIYCADDEVISQGISVYRWIKKPALFSWGQSPENDLHWTGEWADAVPYGDSARRQDAAHAAAIAATLGIAPQVLKEKIKQLPEVEMRVQMTRGRNGSTLIHDYYNSDWESIENALSYLGEQHQNERKSIVLTDILENSHDHGVYERVVEQLNDFGAERLILIGSQWKRYLNQLPGHAQWFESTDALLAELDDLHFHDEAILLKGARRFALERVSRRLALREHPTVLEIRMPALIHNLRYYRENVRSDVKLMAMVKAFSYGTGTYEIANVLRFHRIDYLAVAYPDEGVHLRNEGIDLPILVLNSEQRNFEVLIKYRLEPELYSIPHLCRFIETAEQLGVTDYPVQFKIETGMNRLGIDESDLDTAISALKATNAVRVKAAFTHLAAADDPSEREFTLGQLDLFGRLTARLTTGLGHSFLRHALNSAGTTHYPEAQFDMVRLGIGLYGISSDESEQPLIQLVGRWVSEVAQIKKVKAGDSIGYSRAYRAEKNTRIATISLGYADGLPRKPGNGVGRLYWKGQSFPIVGRVCMDMCMIEIGDAPMSVGDEIVVFETAEQMWQLARDMDTIPYEVLTSISNRVRRVYLQE